MQSLVLEEAEVRIGMHPAQRLEPVCFGRQHLAQSHLAHARDDQLGALPLLEAGQELAVDQLGLAVLQPVALAVDRPHRRSLPQTSSMAKWAADQAPGHASAPAARSGGGGDRQVAGHQQRPGAVALRRAAAPRR